MSTSHDNTMWFVLVLNPEPWAVGPLSVGRKGGRYYPIHGRNQQLYSFQEAVRTELRRQEAASVVAESYELILVFHQVLERYQTISGRWTQDKPADLTNLVKATEDAIQGILISNDVKVEKQTNYVQRTGPGVDNAVPYILIGVRPYLGMDPGEIPGVVWDLLDVALIERKESNIQSEALPEQDVF